MPAKLNPAETIRRRLLPRFCRDCKLPITPTFRQAITRHYYLCRICINARERARYRRSPELKRAIAQKSRANRKAYRKPNILEKLMTWNEKITALKLFILRIDPLWTGTKLSGYAESGPYHCGNCVWLASPDKCTHPIVGADMEVLHRPGRPVSQLPIVNASRGCCEFVEPRK